MHRMQVQVLLRANTARAMTHKSFDPMLFLNLGSVKGQCIQNLMEVASCFVQPRDGILEFLCANFFGQAITDLVTRRLQQVRR